jgi:hypothetical protein
MTPILFSPAAVAQTSISAGQLPAVLQHYQSDLQTGLVDLSYPNDRRDHLLFVRGDLVNVYREAENQIERLDPSSWNETLSNSQPAVLLRALALTPQAVRIVKILIEQGQDKRNVSTTRLPLEAQFKSWVEHPVPALAQIRWPSAEALALLPGEGIQPRYTLFVAADQILHSTGNLMALYGWKEPYRSAVLFSSQPSTVAWTEYLLHYSFSWLVTHLLERFEELTGHLLLNNMLREINFTTTAHGWSVQFHRSSITDQTIFPSPSAAAKVYSRLLEIVFGQIEAVLGLDLLNLLVRESVSRLSRPCRVILNEYLMIEVPSG